MQRERRASPTSVPAASAAEDAQVTDKLKEPASSDTSHLPLLLWVHPEPRITAIPQGTTSVGRGSRCDLVLNGSLISRRHARFERRGDAIEVVDEGSSNGVHVNGRACSSHLLAHRDVIRVVDHVTVFVWGEPRDHEGFAEVSPGVWGSRCLERTFERVERIARTRLAVLIQGETGTGKEALARSVHERSERRGAFIALSCANFTDGLFEAELFGHEQGAFTSAHRSRVGYVERADRGTLFLDEVGELSPSAQAKLLRVIQEGDVLRVGGREPVSVDVRWVAASHRDLTEESASGRFRLDLYHRLAGVTLAIPPLRERPGDILPLLQRFVAAAGGAAVQLSEALVEALCLHDWPGNVRELQRVAESMLAVVGDRSTWQLEQLPADVAQAVRVRSVPGQPGSVNSEPRGDYADREALLRALRNTGGNLAAAARELRCSRQTLYSAIEQHDLAQELELIRRPPPDAED